MNSVRGIFVAMSAATMLLSASGIVARPDVKGPWQVAVRTEADTMKAAFSLEQQDVAVNGFYFDEFGTAAVIGFVRGNEVTLKVRANIPDEDLTVTYTGTLDGNTMKGKVTFGELGEGTFVARKVPS